MNIEVAYKIEEMKKNGASDREVGQASELVAKLLELADRAPKDTQGNLRNALAALGRKMVER